MSHLHPHIHKHAHHDSSGKHTDRAFILASLLMSGLTLVEIIYGLHINAMAIIADAIHNLGDLLGLLFAGFTNYLLKFKPREKYSYGFKRASIISSLLNGTILIITTTLIIYESLQRLLTSNEINPMVMLWIGIFGVIINGASAALFMRSHLNDLNVKIAFIHLLADAAIAGGIIAAAIIIYATSWWWVDPVAALIISMIIAWGTLGLFKDTVRLMLDAVPKHIDVQAIKHYFSNLPNVLSLHDLHIWGISTNEFALTVHLVIEKQCNQDILLKKIQHNLREKFSIEHITIQLETQDMQPSCTLENPC